MITRFTRSFIKTCVDHKICDDTKLRDYDILKDHAKGMTLGQLSIKYHLSIKHIHHLIKKY